MLVFLTFQFFRHEGSPFQSIRIQSIIIVFQVEVAGGGVGNKCHVKCFNFFNLSSFSTFSFRILKIYGTNFICIEIQRVIYRKVDFY